MEFVNQKLIYRLHDLLIAKDDEIWKQQTPVFAVMVVSKSC